MATQNSIDHKSSDLTVDPGASGDSFVQFDINGTGEFRIGVDDDASDAFKISQGSALGSNDTFVMSSAGELTMPLQPAFLAYLGTTDSSVTGDGTGFTLGAGNALTEVFDQGGDFVTTGTFTAPVTGRYEFCGSVNTDNTTTASCEELEIIIKTSNGNYSVVMLNPAACDDPDELLILNGSVQCDMDAADTATFYIEGSRGTKTIDIISSNRNTFFAGYLMC